MSQTCAILHVFGGCIKRQSLAGAAKRPIQNAAARGGHPRRLSLPGWRGALMLQIQCLELSPRPGCPSKKFQTRRHAGVMGEAADADAPGHLRPADAFDQFGQHFLQRDAVKRIIDLWLGHLSGAGSERLHTTHASLSDGGQARPVSGMTSFQNKVRIEHVAVAEYNCVWPSLVRAGYAATRLAPRIPHERLMRC